MAEASCYRAGLFCKETRERTQVLKSEPGAPDKEKRFCKKVQFEPKVSKRKELGASARSGRPLKVAPPFG